MKQIILTFEMNKGLVGMKLTTMSDNSTDDEEIVAHQMIEHITSGKLPSPTIAIERGDSMDEAIEKANIVRDIYLSDKK